MLTKDDFLRMIADSVASYPAIAALYQAGDPRVLQPQAAMAQMFAMISQQQELAMAEPFSKVRDSTVLADASLKGLVPVGTPARVKVKVSNQSGDAYALASGRTLFDTSGNIYVVDTPVNVPASGSAFTQLLQQQYNVITDTVSSFQPFYRIQIPQPDGGLFVSGISVQDAGGIMYEYRADFVNTLPGEKVYHIECDEYQRMFIVLGYDGIVGYQPLAGEVLTVTITETVGVASPTSGSQFALQYTYTPQDGLIQFAMDSLLIPGANPTSIATMRELSKYPSIYDSNAVFLGEFDFLVRRNLPGLRFLSIWNETLEEQVRGASVDNINCLFCAFVEPLGADRAAVQAQIVSIIGRADDAYEVKFVPVVTIPITVTIAATVSRVHDDTAVKQQVQEFLLAEYGQDTPAAQVGMLTPQYKVVYNLLQKSVPALQDSNSDFTVVIDPPTSPQLPEQYRYMSEASLTITISLADYNIGSFGR